MTHFRTFVTGMLKIQLVAWKYCTRSRSTIYALSSGLGKCGVAVIRVSGPSAQKSLKLLGRMKALPEPRKAILRRIIDPVTSEILDRGLLLWFPEPHSFTGEDCCEFHVHGGPAVVSDIMSALGKIGCVPAARGEFTKRAFHAGKLDLTEVEGLADLIHAETEMQRRQALRQMEGELGKIYSGWRKLLTKAMANCEAFIDFGEDESLEERVLSEAACAIKKIIHDMQVHLHDGRRGERLRNGIRIAILGEPNVGKSSLLNILSRKEAAIVSPVPGTTRDIVETCLNIGGYPVIIADTAGMHSTTDPIELEGMRRAREYAATADLAIILINATEVDMMSKTDFESKYITKNFENLSEKIVVLNKIDLLESHNLGKNCCLISCKTETGIPEFLKLLEKHIAKLCADPTASDPYITQARHRHHVVECLKCLESFIFLYENNSDLVLVIEELRKALRQLGSITGHVSTEQILDVIFRDFCIGK